MLFFLPTMITHKNLISYFSLTAFLFLFGSAQTFPVLTEAFSAGSAGGSCQVLQLKRGPGSSLYTWGIFTGTVDFDPGPGVANQTSLPGDTSLFYARYDTAFNYVWAIRFDINPILKIGFYTPVSEISLDAAGNMYAGVTLTGSVDFDAGPGVTMLNAGTGTDIVIFKYSAAGIFQWAFNLGNSKNAQFCDLTVAQNGVIYMLGNIEDTVDMDPSVLTSNAVYRDTFSVNNQGPGLVFARYTSNGNFVWSKVPHPLKNYYVIKGTRIVLGPNQELMIAGQVNCAQNSAGHNIDFDPGPGTTNCGGMNNTLSFFVNRYDTSGAYQWYSQFEMRFLTNSFFRNMGLVVDSFGNSTLAFEALYGASIFYNPSTTQIPVLVQNVAASIITVFRRNSNGVLTRALEIGDTSTFSASAYFSDLTLTPNNGILVLGSTNSRSDFKPGPVQVSIDVTQGNSFVVEYDSSFNFKWVGNIKATTTSLAIDPGVQLFLGGSVAAANDMEFGAATQTLAVTGIQDLELGRYAWPPCTPLILQAGIQNLSACTGDTLTLIPAGAGTVIPYSWFKASNPLYSTSSNYSLNTITSADSGM